MSSTVAKIFAMWIRTDNANVKAMCWRRLAKIHAKSSACFYIKGGQRHTVHGNIPFGEPVKPKRRQRPQPTGYGPYVNTSPPEPKPQRRHKQPKSEPKRYAPPPPTEDPGPTVRYSNLRPDWKIKPKRRKLTRWEIIGESMMRNGM